MNLPQSERPRACSSHSDDSKPDTLHTTASSHTTTIMSSPPPTTPSRGSSAHPKCSPFTPGARQTALHRLPHHLGPLTFDEEDDENDEEDDETANEEDENE